MYIATGRKDSMNYVEKLQARIDERVAKGQSVMLRFFPSGDPDATTELLARAAFETLDGTRERTPFDVTTAEDPE